MRLPGRAYGLVLLALVVTNAEPLRIGTRPRPLHRHEPRDFVPIAENDFSRLPGWPPDWAGLRGQWWAFPTRNPNLAVVSVPDAPESPPYVLETRFPAGLSGGTEPVSLGGWDTGDVGTQSSSIYFAVWIRILGDSYENQAVGTKLGFFGYASARSRPQNDGYLMLQGVGVQKVLKRSRLEFRQQNYTSRNLEPNVDRSLVMTVGPWHHVELLMELNKLGVANGRLNLWVDDKRVLDYRDVVYIVPGATSRFEAYKWAPTWGGAGGIRSRSDAIQIDHVYISGRR